MEGSVTAIVIRAEERKDSDYLLRLFSAEGVISAVMRGVRKASSKMKFAAQPRSACTNSAAEVKFPWLRAPRR